MTCVMYYILCVVCVCIVGVRVMLYVYVHVCLCVCVMNNMFDAYDVYVHISYTSYIQQTTKHAYTSPV